MITTFLNESYILSMVWFQLALYLFIPAVAFCLMKVFED